MGLFGEPNMQDPCPKCGSTTVHSPNAPFCDTVLGQVGKRLAEIENALAHPRGSCVWPDDARWLISQVRALREALRKVEAGQAQCPVCGLEAADFETVMCRHAPDCEIAALLAGEEDKNHE